jgi:hypothetical protein
MKNSSIFDLFPGIAIYDTEPVAVRNPFSGETAVLTPEEVAVYDYIKGCEMMGDYQGLRRGLDWFMAENPDAYMTLLD